MGKNPDPGSASGMNNPDHFHFPAFLGPKYLNSLTPTGMEKIEIRDTGWNKFISWIREGKNSDPGSGLEKIQIWDSGWEKFGSGIRDGKKSDPRFGIRDKHPGSATLLQPELRNLIFVLVQRERL
jgi:hypothetical protein